MAQRLIHELSFLPFFPPVGGEWLLGLFGKGIALVDIPLGAPDRLAGVSVHREEPVAGRIGFVPLKLTLLALAHRVGAGRRTCPSFGAEKDEERVEWLLVRYPLKSDKLIEVGVRSGFLNFERHYVENPEGRREWRELEDATILIGITMIMKSTASSDDADQC